MTSETMILPGLIALLAYVPGCTSDPPETSDTDTTTGTATGDDSTESGNGTAAFVNEPDVGPRDGCDLWVQDCPEDQKCTPIAQTPDGVWDGTACSPRPEAPRRAGETCTIEGHAYSGIDDCERGSICWATTDQEGICRPLCTGDPGDPQCPGGKTCLLSFNDTVSMCLDDCDPLEPMCQTAEVCIPSVDAPAFICWPDTFSNGRVGSPCNLDSCRSGLACVEQKRLPDCSASTSTYGCCAVLCDTRQAEPETCTADAPTCTPWFAEPTEGLDHVGFCTAG